MRAMRVHSTIPAQKSSGAQSRELWLRKHADYQRVYREGKRQSLPQMTYFFAARTPLISPASKNDEEIVKREEPSRSGARVGLTAGRVLGNAVERNRIKRRMRAAVRQNRAELTASVDVVLHPRRSVLEADFDQIEREVLRAFRAVQLASQRLCAPHPPSTQVSESRPGAPGSGAHRQLQSQ